MPHFLRNGFLAVLLLAAGLPAAYAQAPGAKPPIHGLVTMGKLSFVTHPEQSPQNDLREALTHPGVYAGAVLIATWAQLEPTRGQYNFSVLDQGLANMRAYNKTYPATPLVAKLRIFAGAEAPEWAKKIGGPPVTITEHDNEVAVGRFWSAEYGDAWRQLQVALARRYDDTPLVHEVAISSCAASTAEPFVVPVGERNLPALTDAGYSDAAMKQCLMGAIDDYAPWQNVAIDYTFNPWRSTASGTPRPDPSFTLKVMDAFRARYGARGVIANHGLLPQIYPPARSLIDEMHRLGPPIEFQSRGPVQDWPATIQTAERLGVTEMELWNSRDAGGAAPVTMDELREWRSQLAH
jgi:hypothetical protein